MKKQLCWWLFAHVFKCLKRRTFLITLCVVIAAVFLIKWGFMCSKIQPIVHIKHICEKYVQGNSVGNLCEELCQPFGVTSLSCQNMYMEKEAVFSGMWMNMSIIFKLLKKPLNKTALLIQDQNYPSENYFSNMIKNTIKLKFNISVNDVDARKMSFVQYNKKNYNRYIEMENVWSLLQDNEYLASSLYEKFGIFPRILGSCGSLYAVQKLNSISGYWHLMSLYDSRYEWEKRLKIALLILDFLFRLEHDLPEPLHICDVKMNHFGVTDDLKKVMYLDLDSVHPVTIANKIIRDKSQCNQHSDCDFLDCRSFCNMITYKCDHGVVNNNLQIVCERIFLGWVMSGRVMLPGLLLGPYTPRILIELLEKCANPVTESEIPRAPATKDIRKRLYKLLTHLTLS